MHPAHAIQLARIARDYALWLAVPDGERAAAPASWWSVAFALRDETQTMPVDIATLMRLPSNAAVRDGARRILAALAEQTHLPWPDEFPRRFKHASAEAAHAAQATAE